MNPGSSTLPTPLSLDQWFGLPPVQLLRSNASHATAAHRLYTARMNPTQVYYPTPTITDDIVVVNLRGRNFVEIHAEDGTRVQGSIAPGAVQLAPRQVRYTARWMHTTVAAFIAVPRAVMESLIATWGRGDPAHAAIVFRYGVRDPLLLHLCFVLLNQLDAGDAEAAGYADKALEFLAAHLLTHYSGAAPLRIRAGGKLNARQCRMLEEFIDAHLGSPMPVPSLAATLHLSASHFSRLFGATYQCSPRDYILQRRIERARSLLQCSPLTLYDVARACGFADQSHFTRHFTKIVGVSPARYRGQYQ